MNILPDFNLPSDPAKIVRLHEATVSDAIDFSEIRREAEEEATTLFLERLQEKATYSDPRLWTQEDRRFALFMYHVYTSQDAFLPLTWTCDNCSKDSGQPVRHTVPVYLKDMIDEYMPIDGQAIRDVVHEGHAIIVHPVLGKDAELIEKSHLSISYKENSGKKSSKERAQLGLFRFLCCIDIPALEPNANAEARRPRVQEFVSKMGITEFREFQKKVYNALASMRHGLRMVYNEEANEMQLESPVIYCPKDIEKKEGLRLFFPFRAFDHIPVV